MTPTTLDRRGLAAGLSAFCLWGVFPLLFDAMAALGAQPLEIVGWRTVFAAPFAIGLVIVSGRGREALALMRRPRELLVLAASAGLIAVNWSIYVWAVTTGRTLEASLGYFINPLVNLAFGAVFFKERLSRAGMVGVGFAVLGVLVQTLALHALPWISLVLALSFGGYGAVRKNAAADAPTGLLIECLFLLTPALLFVGFLGFSGHGRFGRDPVASLLLFLAGPATVFPLAAFSFAARRLPLSLVGFLQFVSPTLQFACGLLLGERLHLATLLAFSLIWIGAGVFVAGAFRRAPASAPRTAAPAEAAS